MSAAAFRASYSDWKLIKTRSCVQIIFEVPLSEADAAYQVVGGMPDPASERWFAIARLDTGPGPTPVREAEGHTDPAPASRPRSFAQQAGICCNNPAFRLFLQGRGYPARGVEEAAATVRQLCGVTSRSEIVPGTQPGNAWCDLHADFEAWRLVA